VAPTFLVALGLLPHSEKNCSIVQLQRGHALLGRGDLVMANMVNRQFELQRGHALLRRGDVASQWRIGVLRRFLQRGHAL
jgi:hypothetical protein